MVRLVVLIALAGCGRFAFDDRPDGAGDAMLPGDVLVDVVPLGHDEDGDGVPDTTDTCPHLAAPQDDADGDGVGDACDPNPTVAGDRIVLFATMMPGDQPLLMPDVDGVYTQLADAIRFDGPVGPDNNLYGRFELPIQLGSFRMAVGFDILQVIENTTINQKQFALGALHPPPMDFVELNEIDGLFDAAQITRWTGTDYFQQAVRDLASGIHTGPVFFQTTQRVGTSIEFEVAWPGEPYTMSVTDGIYQGTTQIDININNLHLEIRYVIVISSP
jgi:hypothetical protein